jgi:septal ring factor EnvC (AmiA/AmiB activator)
MKFARILASAVATGVVLVGASPVAHADEAPTDSPCATQEAKVAKAEDALARVTAVFENKKDRVAEAEAALAAASTDKEKAKAEKRLAKAVAKAADAKKAKKAQKQRLAKAEQRLAECEAENAPAAP